MPSMIRRLFFAAITFSVVSPCVAQQDSDALVSKMLEDGWSVTATARELVDELYASRSADELVRDSYRLALMKQRRYPDALKVTRKLVRQSDDGGETHFGHDWCEVWLLMVTKQYESALERSVEVLTDAEGEGRPDSETIEGIGATLGFLEGPGNGAVASQILTRKATQLRQALNEDELEAFERGRKIVIEMFETRLQQSGEADAREFQAAQQDRQVRSAQVAANRTRVAQDQAELAQRQSDFDTQSRSAANDLQQRESEANSIAVQSADRAGFLRSRLFLIDADLARIELEISQTTDPAVLTILNLQRNDMIFAYNATLADLSAADSQAAIANTNLARTQRDRIASSRQRERERQELERSRRALDRKQAKLDREESKLAQTDTKLSARARVEKRKATSWMTYYPYPLETEKQQLLGLLGE